MKKVASILAVALFTLGMFAAAINTIAPDFSDITTAVASDDDHTERDERDG